MLLGQKIQAFSTHSPQKFRNEKVNEQCGSCKEHRGRAADYFIESALIKVQRCEGTILKEYGGGGLRCSVKGAANKKNADPPIRTLEDNWRSMHRSRLLTGHLHTGKLSTLQAEWGPIIRQSSASFSPWSNSGHNWQYKLATNSPNVCSLMQWSHNMCLWGCSGIHDVDKWGKFITQWQVAHSLKRPWWSHDLN